MTSSMKESKYGVKQVTKTLRNIFPPARNPGPPLELYHSETGSMGKQKDHGDISKVLGGKYSMVANTTLSVGINMENTKIKDIFMITSNKIPCVDALVVRVS